MKYKVELFIKNNWIIHSWHKNEDFAIFNAENISKGRKCDARVVYKGDIVQQFKGLQILKEI